MSNDFDAIVIGGGFAGVTATRDLQHRGLNTLLLEARDRLGGRTWTSSFNGHRLEMGGTWVHWFQPHIWPELTRYGIPVVEDDPPETAIMPADGGVARFSAEEAFPRLDALLERYCEGNRETMDRPYDPLFRTEAIEALDRLSVGDRLEQLGLSHEDHEWLSGMMSMMAGQPTAEAGFVHFLRWWSLAGRSFELVWDTLARYRPKSGTISIIEAMLADAQAEVRLSSPVERVEQGEENVRVTTAGGETFSASVAVVAVPVKVWDSIEFSPTLSSCRLDATREGVAAPHGAKVWAEIAGEPDRVYIQPAEGHPFTMLWTYKQMEDRQLLVAFGGDPALEVTDHGQVRRAILDVLPGAEILGITGHDWNNDPYARSTWSYMKTGQLTRLLPNLQRPEGRLVFATSDIASGWSGFIDGAVESGIRAARIAREMADVTARSALAH